MEVKLWVATKAIVNYKGKVLILRESSKYEDGTNINKYNVPGGRIQPGQGFRESLLREIMEETGLNVVIGKPFFVGEWWPLVRGEQWQIVGTYFEVFADSDVVKLSKDHDDYKWIRPEDCKKYPIIDDMTGAFEAYLSREK